MDNLCVYHKKGSHACMGFIATFDCLFTFYGELFNLAQRIGLVDEVKKRYWPLTPRIFVHIWVFISSLWQNTCQKYKWIQESANTPESNQKSQDYSNQIQNINYFCPLSVIRLQHIVKEFLCVTGIFESCCEIWLLAILEFFPCVNYDGSLDHLIRPIAWMNHLVTLMYLWCNTRKQERLIRIKQN